MPGCAEQAPGQRVEKPSGAPVSETRLRGSSVASEPRSRSSSLNSTDSGSGLQAAPELGRGSQPASQRFSVISSEDFDQELVVKPLKVKKKRKKKTEGGSRNTCHSSLESTPCYEFPGDSPQSLSTDLLSMTSSLGSIVDRSSTESPDQESNLSGEVNGVLQENNDPEAFSVLEVPEPAPDVLNEGNGDRAGLPRCNRADDTEPHSAVWTSLLELREAVEGSDVTELIEEPCPADDELNSRQSPCREQDSSAEAREAEDMPDVPQSTFSEVPFLDSLPVPSSLSWVPHAEQRLPGTRADKGCAEEPSKEQGFLTHMGGPGHLGSHPWHTVTDGDTGLKQMVALECDTGSVGGRLAPPVSALAAHTREPQLEQPSRDQVLTSSDEEDIYAHGLPSSSSETSMTELGGSRSLQDLSQPGADDTGLLKSDQVCGCGVGRFPEGPPNPCS
ncbi:tectonin beta-propeller repeat-containing protein 2-like [Leptonychotes weddellii]|uniref:Tectonin beta-propeller repeat-containing protein 2-like n=1 Tax=Leptonychotes weddellii TaxID=9713 RepID=A0A7F8RMB4_LEPWE|nr:tectonin beta-propeller repeat-containing protein 2-like [Leptonychotes weddellii]